MKFRTLFLVFNIVFLTIFITLFSLPLAVLGSGALDSFWGRQWWLGLLFAGIVIAVNVTFFAYWRLLSLLEVQDWPGLAAYLERKVYNRRRVTASSVRILLESLFLIGDFDGVEKLAELLGKVNQRLLGRFAHRIAAVLIVGQRYAAAEALCAETALNPHRDEDWHRFFSVFLEPLQGKPYPSAALREISQTARDPLVVSLAGYLNSKPGRDAAAAEAAKSRVLASHDRKRFESVLSDAQTAVHGIVLSSLFGETIDWLYGASGE